MSQYNHCMSFESSLHDHCNVTTCQSGKRLTIRNCSKHTIRSNNAYRHCLSGSKCMTALCRPEAYAYGQTSGVMNSALQVHAWRGNCLPADRRQSDNFFVFLVPSSESRAWTSVQSFRFDTQLQMISLHNVSAESTALARKHICCTDEG